MGGCAPGTLRAGVLEARGVWGHMDPVLGHARSSASSGRAAFVGPARQAHRHTPPCPGNNAGQPADWPALGVRAFWSTKGLGGGTRGLWGVLRKALAGPPQMHAQPPVL